MHEGEGMTTLIHFGRCFGLRLDLQYDRESGWLRFGRSRRGWSWTCSRPTFSERAGIEKPLFRASRWRVFYLEAIR